jgi:hypothetical protein
MIRHSTMSGGISGAGSEDRPRLLFLVWNFPPVQAIASVRIWNLAKYLSRLSWKVSIVTPQPDVCKHMEGPAQVEVKLAEEGIQLFVESVARLHRPKHG